MKQSYKSFAIQAIFVSACFNGLFLIWWSKLAETNDPKDVVAGMPLYMWTLFSFAAFAAALYAIFAFVGILFRIKSVDRNKMIRNGIFAATHFVVTIVTLVIAEFFWPMKK